MQEREVQGRQRLDEVRELRDRVRHAHPLPGAEGRDAETDFVCPDGVDDRPGHLEWETRAVLDAPTVLVRAEVADVLNPPVEEPALGGVDLDAVEPGVHGISRRLDVVDDHLLHAFVRHRFEVVRGRSVAAGPELTEDIAAFRVDCIGDLVPCFDLLRGIDGWTVCPTSSSLGDEGSLRDEKGSGDRGTLFIIGDGHWQWDMRVAGSKSRQGCKHHAMHEGHVADFERFI